MSALVRRSLTIGEPEVFAYAELSGDFNPLHLNEDFARQTAHGSRIAHGTISLNLLWQSIAASVGEDGLPGCSLEVRFVKPVYLGDTVTTGSEDAAGEDGALAVWVKNQHGEAVITGTLRRACG